MLRKVLVVVALAAIMLLSTGGCKKRSSEPAEPEVKTMADYEAEAEKEITPETMEAELEKLEKEVEADISSGQ